MLNRNPYLCLSIYFSLCSNAMIEIPILHSGPVKGLARSCFQPNLIASGATNGEVIKKIVSF